MCDDRHRTYQAPSRENSRIAWSQQEGAYLKSDAATAQYHSVPIEMRFVLDQRLGIGSCLPRTPSPTRVSPCSEAASLCFRFRAGLPASPSQAPTLAFSASSPVDDCAAAVHQSLSMTRRPAYNTVRLPMSQLSSLFLDSFPGTSPRRRRRETLRLCHFCGSIFLTKPPN